MLKAVLFSIPRRIVPDRPEGDNIRNRDLTPARGSGLLSVMERALTVREVFSRKPTLLALLWLAAASVLNMLASALIQHFYPDRPQVPDVFFSLLPDLPVLAYASEPVMAATLATALVYAWRHDRDRFPFLFFLAGLLYMLRAPLILLTPLGRPTGNLDSYGIFEVIELKQHGMFPSGHMALSALVWFYIGTGAGRNLKHWAGLFAVLQAAVLLLSRGHYSIDLVGGVMTAYITCRIARRYRDRFRLRRTEEGPGP